MPCFTGNIRREKNDEGERARRASEAGPVVLYERRCVDGEGGGGGERRGDENKKSHLPLRGLYARASYGQPQRASLMGRGRIESI